MAGYGNVSLPALCSLNGVQVVDRPGYFMMEGCSRLNSPNSDAAEARDNASSTVRP